MAPAVRSIRRVVPKSCCVGGIISVTISLMRILKFLAAAFMAVVAASSLQARTDSDVQAKARAALEQAESQPASQTAPAPAPVTPPPKPAAQPAPKPVTPPPPVAVPVAAAAPVVTAAPSRGLSPDDEARAREAMRAAVASGDTTANAAMAPVAKATPPPMKTSTPPPAVHSTQPAPIKFTPPPSESAPAAAPATSGVHATASAAISRQARLNDLLNKYKMDQITPQQYFQEKAKILAEP